MTLRTDSDVFLHPGEFYFGAAPCRIGTLLGSCVSVTMWCPFRKVGGMSHIMLPDRKRTYSTPLDGKYADEAIELFMVELKRRGIEPELCQVKLFGGSNMLPQIQNYQQHIGQRNLDATRHTLARKGFSIQAEHVGGNLHRRLYLDLASGHVWLSSPERSEAPAL